jgi:DNA-binding response OmpR family regulator
MKDGIPPGLRENDRKMNEHALPTAGLPRNRAAVLVVDPDPAALDYLARTLQHAGYDPDTFPDLDERSGSVDRLGADPPVQVALLDARALDPLEDGPSLAELRRRSPRRVALQFVVIGEPERLDRVLPRQITEVTDILPKPIDRNTLLFSMQEAVRRHAALLSRGAGLGAPPVLPSRRGFGPRRELPADLQVLQWLRDIDDQRLKALDGVVEVDATWNMLSELLRARITRRRITVTSLCLASRGPVTSALRRVERLLREGLITYTLDPRDRRRKYVELTNDGVNRMQTAVRGVAQRWAASDPPRMP